MIRIRKATDRGRGEHDWLDSRHTFSFSEYHDPRHMGFRSLRVMNEDRVEPDQGFGTHPHRDMEIITYVLEGNLEHRDSMGNGSILAAGDFQRMTAGTGIRHSEFNPSSDLPVHFYQIWIEPDAKGLPPGYEQHSFADDELANQLRLVASVDGRRNSLTIHQQADVYLSRLDAGSEVSHQLEEGRHAWLQVLRGEVSLNGQPLDVGDGAAVSNETTLSIESKHAAEIMLFDLA